MNDTELPKRCFEATMLRPAPATAVSVWLMAAMPVLSAVTLIAPVVLRTLLSRYCTVGLEMRE
jgi:hypothetical protein